MLIAKRSDADSSNDRKMVGIQVFCVASHPVAFTDAMSFLLKLSIAIVIIVFCAQIGRKLPSLAGLIATMPLTGLIVLMWLYSDNPGDHELLVDYTRGAVWGILPSIFFFLAAYVCLQRHLPIPIVLAASFAVWLLGALLHQWFLR